MAMVVKNNMSAINTLNTLNKNTNALKKSLEKVSSGMKINSAADDASGYAISERMRVQIRSLDQANQNAQNGGSMMKVAEGAVSSTVEILKTLKEKAVNAANDTNTDSDRATIQKELDQSIDQINDNANVTFNGKYLVDGSHNKKTIATTTRMTNQSLATTTDKTTKLVDLAARNGDPLNIHSTDTVTVSYVKDGKTVTASTTVGDKQLANVVSSLTGGAITVAYAKTASIGIDGSKNAVKTASGENAITLSAKTAGIDS
uniref:flagellin n=1 Tax=Anaerovibrio lipolyticus TaxID=82374 RepID=UPI0026E91FA5